MCLVSLEPFPTALAEGLLIVFSTVEHDPNSAHFRKLILSR